jgi:hypothetical protein
MVTLIEKRMAQLSFLRYLTLNIFASLQTGTNISLNTGNGIRNLFLNNLPLVEEQSMVDTALINNPHGDSQ